MSRTESFANLRRIDRLASAVVSRRQVLKGGLLLGAAALGGGAFGALQGSGNRGANKPKIAIIGGGLAGLACADRLRAKGYSATIYEASGRVGGRQKSLRGFFPGQVAELGGEFIDTGHKTMIAYAREFGLTLEDVTREPGGVRYYFFGQAYSEDAVVAQYRELSRRMQADARASSGAPTFYNHNQADVDLDNTSLRDYLLQRAPDMPLIRAVIEEAYVAEYGLEPWEQSCLNFLLFIRINRQSKFEPFGTSDERYHVVEGNDAISSGIAARLPGPILFGKRLTSLRKTSGGQYEMSFADSSTASADFVVVSIPFTVLRGVSLHSSLGLSSDKLRAINELGYGYNAKTMVGFQGKPWFTGTGSSGAAYSDLLEVQTTWQTNPLSAGSTSILTDYAGGDRGLALGSRTVASQVEAWLNDLDVVYPGSKTAASGSVGARVAVREDWPSNPLTLGAYTCYKPGQFTGIAGLESEAAGALKFAGEHTDSFYSWQGYMEGACLSGIRAANEVLADVRAL
ncbi:MAG: FAD-dependent oxidoreductase [Fimbriimonadales bacterium]